MRTAEQVWSGKSRPIPTKTLPGGDGGAAAVEFALVVPILLALIFGIINFGFIFAAQISLNSSARDAARAGVVKPLSTSAAMTCSQIALAARNGATTLGLDKTRITITVTGPAGNCTSPPGGGTLTGVDVAMCTQPASPPTPVVTQLDVLLTYTAVSPAPLVPPTSAPLSAKGVFQCEYV